MRPRNFPARKLRRQLRLIDGPTADDMDAWMEEARRQRSKKRRTQRRKP